MGLFGQLFGSRRQNDEMGKSGVSWIPLTELEQLNVLKERSYQKTQYVYKHSTTCGISGMVLRMLENKEGASGEEADFYFLDLHRYRDISNAVAGEFQIRHESPQLIILKEGEVVKAASHGAITELDLDRYQ